VTKKALLVTWELFQDHEVIYPYYRLTEEDIQVTIMSNKVGRIYGLLGAHMDSNALISELDSDAKFDEYLGYDLLIVPGGVKALEKLRQEPSLLRFINSWHNKDKPIGSICHGAQLLISSQVVKGKKISGYYSIKDDINNAGAEYVDAPVVSDGGITTSPHYMHMGPWMKAVIDML